MAVSRRLRFEVLRRDNFTCRYCGASAPDVRLEVDHVTPRSLGGPDKPWNLVAACQDCNGGKSAMAADEPLIEGPSEEALRTMRAAREVIGYLWGALPQRVDLPAVRAQLANRFADDHLVDGDEWMDYSGWSRELMAFAQAVHDVCELAVHAESAPKLILNVLSQSARARWISEACEAFLIHDYTDAPDYLVEETAIRHALKSYASVASAGDVKPDRRGA